MKNALFQYLLRIGDTNLVLSHRLSQLCSRGPFLEEDIALTNIALDHIGQAEALLKYAGEVEGRGRSEDDLAYLRSEVEFRNCLLVEQPNTDFAYVIVRQFFIDVWEGLLYNALSTSKDETLAGMGVRFAKETAYHFRHSGSWMVRLGQGTEESHRRLDQAFRDLWHYTGELFETDDNEAQLAEAGIAPRSDSFRAAWLDKVKQVAEDAGLALPATDYMASGGRVGIHSEHLGHLLAEMQYLQRAYPGAKW